MISRHPSLFLLPLVLAFVVAGILTGCTSGPPKPSLLSFEEPGFMRVYQAERDKVIRQTAPAFKRCQAVTLESTVELRRQCKELDAILEEWNRRDAVIDAARLSGQPVSSFDWEKAAGVAGKLIGAAAGIAL